MGFRFLFYIIILLTATISYAEESTVKATGLLKHNYARIILHTPSSQQVKIVGGDGKVTLKANVAIIVDPEAIGVTMDSYITKAVLSKDKRSLTLIFKGPNIRFRQFVGENAVGVDILSSPNHKEPENKESRKEEKKKEPEAPPASKEKLKIEKAENKKKATVEETTVQKSPVSAVKEKEIETKSVEEANPPRAAEKVDASFTFSAKPSTALASFMRGDTLWLVFDKSLELPLPQHEFIQSATKTTEKLFTVLYINFKPGVPVIPTIRKEESNWILELKSQGELKPLTPLSYKIMGTKSQPTVFITAGKIIPPIRISDPNIGDDIFIIPMTDPGQAFPSTRHFPEFTILKTSQGIAIERRADHIRISSLKDGIEISSSQGLTLSPKEERSLQINNDKSEQESIISKTKPQHISLLPFSFKQDERKGFNELRQEFLHNVLKGKNEMEKNMQRINLARFYFYNKHYADALGVIETRSKADPIFANDEESLIILGASYFLINKYPEAKKILKKFLDNHKTSQAYSEAHLLYWASNYLLPNGKREDNIKSEYNFLVDPKDTFLGDYPTELRQLFLRLVIMEKIEANQLNRASVLYEKLAFERPEGNLKKAAQYVQGIVAEKSGRSDEAEILWQELIEQTDDQKSRLQGAVALARLKVDNGTISAKEAIKMLEPVRIIWRKDDSEAALLQLIGELYIKDADYLMGLRAWREYMTHYPNHNEAATYASRMRETFIKLFSGEKIAYKMPPLQTLAVYFEFRDLTPVGKDGDIMIRDLAEHFVRADLLDSAAVLLAHQIKFRSEGEDKARLVVRLAQIQLQNKKPGYVLETIDSIKHEKKSEDTARELDRLRILALKDLNQTDKALSSLESNSKTIEGAELIKLDLYWQTKNWPALIKILEPDLEYLIGNKDVIDGEKAERIVRLALAYNATNNKDALQKLVKTFADRMKNSQDKKILINLEQNLKQIKHDNLEGSLSIDSLDALLKSYKEEKPKASEKESKEKTAEETK